jgi:hypothetical protein
MPFVPVAQEQHFLDVADQLWATLMTMNAGDTWLAEQRHNAPFDLVARALRKTLGGYGVGEAIGIYEVSLKNGTKPSETVAHLRELGDLR